MSTSKHREKINGHTIEIESGILQIDGASVEYMKNDDGYHIFYQKPQPTLVEAARQFIKTQPSK